MPDSREKIAWLEVHSTTYVVSLPENSRRSPVRDLIEAIYERESAKPASQARTILRERIHSNLPASISDRETVKVAAKRLSAPSDRPPPIADGLNVVSLAAPPASRFEIPGLARGTRVEPREIPALLARLKDEITRHRERWTSDRPVSTLLVDASGVLIAYAWNTNAAIRTRHAEWNLCDSLGDAPIPAGARLYVSLKPCRMCAARIWEKAESPESLTVIYLENDPGPLAQGTILDTASTARARFLGPGDPLYHAEISRPSAARDFRE